MTFKLKRIDGIYIVSPLGYGHGRGFSTLESAFAYMRAIIKADIN